MLGVCACGQNQGHSLIHYLAYHPKASFFLLLIPSFLYTLMCTPEQTVIDDAASLLKLNK